MSGGFGLGPFGISLAGLPPIPLPSENQGQITSSRAIDAHTRRFVQTDDGTGAFKGMSDVMQRCLLLISYNVKNPPKILESFASDVEAEIRTALQPLTSGPTPVATIINIAVMDNGRAGTATTLQILDNTTGLVNTIQPKIR